MSLEYSGRGRPPTEEAIKDMKALIKGVEKEPGIPCALLARKLGIKSIRASHLAHRLAEQGLLSIELNGRQILLNLPATGKRK